MDKLAKQEADKAKLLGEKSMEECILIFRLNNNIEIQHWQNIINKKWVNKNAHDKIGMLYYYKVFY